MSPTPLTPDQLAQYRATHQRRQQRLQAARFDRQQKGQRLAQRAADLLKTQFGATEVRLFGSVLRLDRIHLDSDVDLAVTGLLDKDYFTALGKIQDLSSEFSFDLIQLEQAPPRLREKIDQQGLTL